jgi:hypothetical protein
VKIDIINKLKGDLKMPSLNPSKRIDKEIADHADWRGKMLAEIRKTILAADKEIIEEWKWMGTATWSHDGIVCIANIHNNMVKVVFAQGVHIHDPERLFNADLEGNMRRAIKYLEGDKIKKRGLTNLVRASVALNLAKTKSKKNPK